LQLFVKGNDEQNTGRVIDYATIVRAEAVGARASKIRGTT